MSLQAKHEHNNLKYGCGYWFRHASTTAQRMAIGTLSLSATSHVSASPATMNNLLNLVTDPVQPAHHCYQPQSDRPFAHCKNQPSIS